MAKRRYKIKRSKCHVDRHHVVPRSRIPDGVDKDENNIVWWDRLFHERWHALFANMTVAEVHAFIDAISVPGDAWPAGRLILMRERIMKHYSAVQAAK